MKNNLTELVFILDRSGSMSGLESDTIGGFNAMLDKQRKEAGDALITTVLFDNRIELLHDRLPLSVVANITNQDYFVRGSTALLDAIGMAIQKTVQAHIHTAEAHRPTKTMFVIITDGMENASREYRYEQIQRLIEKEKAYGWEFLFLGANIDAIGAASRIGIRADRAVNYHADSEGTQLNYDVVSETVSSFRACQPIADDWKSRIDEDYHRRKHHQR